jgi:hypothetical protein
MLRQAKECTRQILFFIEALIKSLLRMYSITDIKQNCIGGGSDPKRDLLFNLVTRFILSDEVYFLVFNTISVTYQAQLHKLTKLSHDEHLLQTYLNLKALKVKPQFHFDLGFREKFNPRTSI